MARDYLRHVISSVRQISLEAMMPGPTPETNPFEANPVEFNVPSELDLAVNLANVMCQSFRQVKKLFISAVEIQDRAL